MRRPSLFLLLPAGLLVSSCQAPPPPPRPVAPPTGSAPATAGLPAVAPSPSRLPLDVRFRGEDKFRALCARAVAEGWAALPLGERTGRVALGLLGTPYANWTLEIDDRIEAPSANFNALDCWTAYEVPLAFARMIASKPPPWQPDDLLGFIELERYRGGRCNGSYLSRMHHLEEVFYDNQRRSLAVNLTPRLPGAQRLRRTITDMQNGWRSYRYLRANPSLVSGIARMERQVSRLPVWHVPRNRARAAEPYLRTGDIIAITSTWQGGYTSHDGLAIRQPDGSVRFLHATSETSKGRRVILDRRLSDYLAEKPGRAGFVACRPVR